MSFSYFHLYQSFPSKAQLLLKQRGWGGDLECNMSPHLKGSWNPIALLSLKLLKDLLQRQESLGKGHNLFTLH